MTYERGGGKETKNAWPFFFMRVIKTSIQCVASRHPNSNILPGDFIFRTPWTLSDVRKRARQNKPPWAVKPVPVEAVSVWFYVSANVCARKNPFVRPRRVFHPPFRSARRRDGILNGFVNGEKRRSSSVFLLLLLLFFPKVGTLAWDDWCVWGVDLFVGTVQHLVVNVTPLYCWNVLVSPHCAVGHIK